MPMRIVELDLSDGFKPIWDVKGYDGLSILVRYHGQPVGWAHLDVHQAVVSGERLRQAVTDQLGWELMQVVLGEQFNAGEAGGGALPPISVVVCTQDGIDQLQGCLQSLLALDYPDYEVIVVDNAPRSDGTAWSAASPPVRYVQEEQTGLNRARNRGIAEAHHDIITFTDDSSRPDRGWLRAIAHAFVQPEVMAVTGPVVPAKLDTAVQVHSEFGYGMGCGFKHRTFQRDTLTNRELLWARGFGAGANMAFRRNLFATIGSFDAALGRGMPSGGGDDIEMFHRLITRNYTLVYEPTALVWYIHRRDAASLRQLVFDYGRSFGAYLLTCARHRTVSRRSILRFALREWLGWWILRRPRRPTKFPRHLVALELAGALLSPLAYMAAHRRARQIASACQKQGHDQRNSYAL